MPIFLTCFIIFLIWYRIRRRKLKKTDQYSNPEFWERERRAEFIPKKCTSDVPYVRLPVNQLPFGCSTNPVSINLENELKKLDSQPIANLSQYTNTDLKYKYGTVNFDRLAIADDNFALLIRLLLKWGNQLSEENMKHEAKSVYIYALNLGCNSPLCFTGLAKIYADEKNADAIKELITMTSEFSSKGSRLLVELNSLLNDCYVSDIHIPE